MPALARVVENTRMGDGTIESLVRVTTPTERAAVRQARRSALRHNGYSDVFLGDTSDKINVEVQGVEAERPIGLRQTYLVEVEITGAGEFLEG